MFAQQTPITTVPVLVTGPSGPIGGVAVANTGTATVYLAETPLKATAGLGFPLAAGAAVTVQLAPGADRTLYAATTVGASTVAVLQG